jgi:hypothetical protein
MLSPIGTAEGKVGHPFDILRTGVRLLTNNNALVIEGVVVLVVPYRTDGMRF